MVFTKTRPTPISIGTRRRPEPGGRPGYIRVDTVRALNEPTWAGLSGDKLSLRLRSGSGDLDGVKGIYHINMVDEVTEWEELGAVQRISENHLEPLLQRLLMRFPFRALGFHSENGSEFINHRIAGMLNKPLIEQTKSRPRKSNDNGLVESKNGGVLRKHMGFDHIGSEHADAINAFYEQYFNPYLNFHRPCAVPERTIDGKGKTVSTYKWYATPWEILRQFPGLAGYLKDDATVEQMDKVAGADSDTGAATKMRKAKQQLFASFEQRRIA